MTFRIDRLLAIEVLDSRGRPTVRAFCEIDGMTSSATAPSGASTGIHEAWEVRDDDDARYAGMGCLTAVHNVTSEIARAVVGRTFTDQSELDRAMTDLDATPNRSRLGANAILPVSLAAAAAIARSRGIALVDYYASLSSQPQRPSLPRLSVNLFSGGRHAGSQVAVQDVQLISHADSVTDQLHDIEKVYRAASQLVATKYGMRELTADEGGLAPPFATSSAMLADAVEAISVAGLAAGTDISLAVDVASSQFFVNEQYEIDGDELTSKDMIELLVSWCANYPIATIEDGLAEDDWDSWSRLRESLPTEVVSIGDDLLCTNGSRVDRAIRSRAADGLLLKVNQAGSLTDAVEALDVARNAGWTIVVSARSGETEDSWLADLATGWSGDFIKVGSVRQSERLAKYNRLLEIEAGIDPST